MESLKVISVNISKKKGTAKISCQQIELYESGIINDAHAGDWNRQVSMLSIESIHRFEEKTGRKVQPGEFAENITTQGFNILKTQPGDRFFNDQIELEVTQIGKKCHGNSCIIFQEIGDCVMPKEGIFCKVIKPGKIKPGDTLYHNPIASSNSAFYLDEHIFKGKVIILSDRAFHGKYTDKSGPEIIKMLGDFFYKQNWKFTLHSQILPDNAECLKNIITQSFNEKTDLLITTGGTGIGPHDTTVDVVAPFLQKQIPGIMEIIRIKYGTVNPAALLSRSVAGIYDKTLVFTLPGSPKAVREYLNEIFKILPHCFEMLYGIDKHKH
ncbi:MAG TPA: molybdopterin-binding protein [Bacteroidales bacterium]|jgi:molybdenum cofactor synthesis domain-containing protein|nr:molybdopterin-binding protein [Bacteroidales bacterium]